MLPDGFLCYRPPDYAPPVAKLPAVRNGTITFGSFNSNCKLTSNHMALWAEILRAALRAFRENGYAETTLGDIADLIGVRKTALYHYFPDKPFFRKTLGFYRVFQHHMLEL